MDTDRTEEEQSAAIKRIVADHGTKILAAVVLFIAGILAYQGYQHKQLAEKEAASLYYNQLTEVVESSQQLDAAQQEAFDTVFNQLVAEYPASIYASYAALTKAKLDVEKNDLTAAAASLQWVVDQNFSAEIKELAELRLARVLFAQGEFDQSLALLNKQGSVYQAEYAEAKADVLVARGNDGDKAEAISLYNQAKTLTEAKSQTISHILKMKLESLQPEDSAELYPLTADTAAE
jgi:predicted negative regulator of RcsB-dependent stress response